MKPNRLLKIILASASPRRLHILQEHDLSAVVMPANIEETPQKDEEAKIYVTRLAREKAQTILEQVEVATTDIILAVDTTVAYQEHILEKPRDHQDAYRESVLGFSQLFSLHINVYLLQKSIHPHH